MRLAMNLNLKLISDLQVARKKCIEYMLKATYLLLPTAIGKFLFDCLFPNNGLKTSILDKWLLEDILLIVIATLPFIILYFFEKNIETTSLKVALADKENELQKSINARLKESKEYQTLLEQSYRLNDKSIEQTTKLFSYIEKINKPKSLLDLPLT
jgi:predicted histidine transporter YuiF (NhaC family)